MGEDPPTPSDAAKPIPSTAPLANAGKPAWSSLTASEYAKTLGASSGIAESMKAFSAYSTLADTLKALRPDSTIAEHANAIGPFSAVGEYANAIGQDSNAAEAMKAFAAYSTLADTFKTVGKDSLSQLAGLATEVGTIQQAISAVSDDRFLMLPETISAIEPLRNLAGRWIAEFEFESERHAELEKIFAPIREDRERHRAGYLALGALHEALVTASKDESIVRYPPVYALIEALIVMVGDVHPTQADDPEAVFGPVIQQVIEDRESKNQSRKASKSHSGHELQRQFVENAFLSHKGLWISQAVAVTDITTRLIDWVKAERAAGREIGRPLAPTNATNTVKTWISGLLSRAPEAESRLSEGARTRRRNRSKR